MCALLNLFIPCSLFLACKRALSAPGLKIEPGQLTAQVFRGDGLRHVAYEIYVTNFSDFVIRLENLEVSGRKAEKKFCTKTYVGQELNKIYSSAYGPYTTPQNPELEPGQTSVLYVFLNFEEVQTLLMNSLIQ